MAYDALPQEYSTTPSPLTPLHGFLQSVVGRLIVAVASVFVLMPIVARVGKHNQVELVQPIGFGVEVVAVLLGAVVGLILAGGWIVAWRAGNMTFLRRFTFGGRVTLGEGPPGRILAWLMMIVLVVGAVLSATRLARDAVLWSAFAGATTVAVPERFTIVGKVREGRRTIAHLRIRLATGGRTFNFRASAQAYSVARLGETLLLPVETGRGGVQRMVPPTKPIEAADIQHVQIGATGAAPGS